MVTEVENFKITTAIYKLWQLKKRTKVVPGGSSAGKTYGILPILIDRAARTPKTEISVVSESIPHLRKGAMKDFLKIMMATGRYIDKNWNRSFLVYAFENGSYIEFFSADQSDKVRGPRRHILYVNEANNLSYETFDQLQIRTSREVWVDFNPTNEFWAHTELQNDEEDIEWLTLTYKDNEALDAALVREIEKKKKRAYHDPSGDLFDKKNVKSPYWDNWWKVYGMGLLGNLEGLVFNNFEIIPEIPRGAILIGSGLDFGYTNDPAAIVDVYDWNGKRVVHERIYKPGMMNPHIADVLQADVPVWCDAAEPKSRDEIKEHGKKEGKVIDIRSVRKGKDSILFGIQVMQTQHYYVTQSSVNLIRELRGYMWETDDAGKATNKIAKGQSDHAIDALRYHEMESLNRSKKRVAFGWSRRIPEPEADVSKFSLVEPADVSTAGVEDDRGTAADVPDPEDDLSWI